MKKTLFLLISMLSLNLANAQGCLSEGISFTTQEQIDNFSQIIRGAPKLLEMLKLMAGKSQTSTD